MSVRTDNIYIDFSPTCLLTLASHQYENACDLKGVHFLQTDMNTEYKHIAPYQPSLCLTQRESGKVSSLCNVHLGMNTEYMQNTSHQWEYACFFFFFFFFGVFQVGAFLGGRPVSRPLGVRS